MLGMAIMSEGYINELHLRRLKRFSLQYCVYNSGTGCTCFVPRNILTDIKVLLKFFQLKIQEEKQ